MPCTPARGSFAREAGLVSRQLCAVKLLESVSGCDLFENVDSSWPCQAHQNGENIKKKSLNLSEIHWHEHDVGHGVVFFLNTMLNVAELTSLTVATSSRFIFCFGHAIPADGPTTATVIARPPCPIVAGESILAARPGAGQVSICRRILSRSVIQRH